MSAWKDLEREVARLFGGKRNVRGGDFSKSDLDVTHPILALDAKYRKTLATFTWFRKLEEDISRLPEYKGKIPCLVLKEKGKHGMLAVVRADLLRYLIASMDEADYELLIRNIIEEGIECPLANNCKENKQEEGVK